VYWYQWEGGGGRERGGKEVGGWIWCKYCAHIYVNTNMISVETVPGMGRGEDEEEREWG
jgi:hypothetical protein